MEISISGRGLLCTVRKLLPQQLRRVVKLVALLLTAACIQVSAHSYSQTVSFSGKNVPLQAVLTSIEKQTGLSFFFNYVLVKDTRPVTLDVKDVPLEVALDKVLGWQGLDYYKEGKTVFIVKKSTIVTLKATDESSIALRQIDVRGRVVNHLGEPLVSATVAVKNGRKATLTDEKGGFELKEVALNSILQVSYLGYQRKEVKVEDGEIVVQLNLAENQLDEAQVIAYGQTTQRLSVANVINVKGTDIENQPVENPLLALEGRVSGLFITQSSGMPGSGVTVRIQGQNSIANGNDPLYVIDGVPYISQLLSTSLGGQLGNSGIAGVNGNPLNYINPFDIESIEILKDADATAIYGSRAANGAILITTKKGKSGKSIVSFNLQDGWGAVTRMLPLLNTQQYLQMRHEALKNDGIGTPSSSDYDINGLWDSTRNTDWQKTLLGGTAQYTTLSGSMSGGNSTTQYLIGSTYHRETSVFPGRSNDSKGSVHFNLNSASTNQKLKLQLTGSFMFDNNQLPSTDFTSTALRLAPDAPALYKADGTINWQLLSTGAASWTNPLAAYLDRPYQAKTYNLVTSGIISYQIFPGLLVKSNLGYTNLNSNETVRNFLISYSPSSQVLLGTNARIGYYTYNTLNSWIVEPQIEYSKSMGESKVDILIGTTLTQNSSNGLYLMGKGYTSDALMLDVHSAATTTPSSSVYTQYKYGALFGRINYRWKDKYILDLTARRDGSSRFGPETQSHNFGSAGIGWIFSEEKYFKSNFSQLSYGKLRGSYGTTGSDQIGDYRFMDLYSSVSSPVAYQGVTGLLVNNLPNPYLQWEETRKLQAGIELGFSRNRILLIANYVYNRSSNQLIGFTLASVTGFGSISENLPATVQNTAGEFSLSTLNIKAKNFEWSSSLNFTLPNNKLIGYYGQLPTYLYVGNPLGVTPVFHALGVDPLAGRYYFSDSQGHTTFTPNAITDKTILINTAFPMWYGGFQNSVRVRQYHLDFLFQFVKKFAANDLMGPSIPGAAVTNQIVYVLNRWQKPGDLTSTQRYNSNSALFTQYADEVSSNVAYSDASFIRLKNLSLSYELSESALRHIQIQSLRIYVQGQNLLTFTKFKGLDPETGNGSLPPLKVLTVGMQLGL